LLGAGVSRLDGVLYTHEHADQSHGIDDLRMIAINMRARVHIWADPRTLEVLRHRFDYCFKTPAGSGYPPILDPHVIDVDDVNLTIEGPGGPLTITPFWQEHGHIRSLGFRFGGIAYTSDANGIPDESWKRLAGVHTWIVDALRYTHHPSHANVETALEWLERSGARRGILTNLHVDLDYETLKAELPAHVEPAYDGMVVEV
jgi:phosphoribosyl 1,2-cyclic phosphate phosphodiesterase